MTDTLSSRQLALISWPELRICGTDRGAAEIRDLLPQLLHAQEIHIARKAYARLENSVVPQSTLYQCAPAVVSVMIAALTEKTIEPRNLAITLELLCFILIGYSADSEIEAGCENLDELVREEAVKGYWSILELASQNAGGRRTQLAMEILEVLDEEHARKFLGPRWNLWRGSGGKTGSPNSSNRTMANASTRVRRPPESALTKIRPHNGDRAVFDPKTEHFGVMDSTGAPRSFYIPNSTSHRYSSNLEYFNAQ